MAVWEQRSANSLGKGLSMRRIAASAVLAAALSGLFSLGASAQTTQPTGAVPPADKTLAPEVELARKAVAEAVAAVAKDLGSDVLAKREAAQKALTLLSESVISEVLAQVKTSDPEQLARTSELMDALVVSARQARLLVKLAPEDRSAVVELAKADPKSFNRAFSDDDTVSAGAMSALADQDKPGSEIMLRRACQHPSARVRIAAMQAAGKLSKPGKKLADLLLQRLAKTNPSRDYGPYPSGGDGALQAIQRAETEQEYRALQRALVAMKDERVLAALLKRVQGDPHGGWGYGVDKELVELIVTMNDKRTVVSLVELIENNSEVSNITYGNNGPHVTVRRGDVLMSIILRQTGQSLKDYGFFTREEYGDGEAGFESDDKRTAARKKLREWWDRNKKDYEGVKKVSLSDEPAGDENDREEVPAFLR
jgi:hypothetical protein